VETTGSSGGAGGDGQRATCVFEYVASQEGDLTIQVDDVIVVVDSSNPDCKMTTLHAHIGIQARVVTLRANANSSAGPSLRPLLVGMR
jgi:hypothetical protein